MKISPIKIRKFSATDARSVSRLVRRCLLEVNSEKYPQSIIDQMLRAFSPAGVIQRTTWLRCYVASRNSRIVGTGGICDNRIYSVFVSPHLHGKGIGRAIVAHLEKIAIKSGYRKVYLGSSLNAEKFYRSLGYRKIKRLSEPLGGTVVEMSKLIKRK